MISPDSILQIDDRQPEKLLFPGDESELACILSAANAEKSSILAIGGATHLDWGNPLLSAATGVVLSRMNRILDYRPEDLYVTVQPGCSLASLQGRLAEQNQFLPLDPYITEESTVGGLVAVNAYGPMRMQYGRWRDHILGMRVVTAAGTPTCCGGKVVKNVSGYDLPKFYTGSMGWLGIFSEFHLKTSPVPEYYQSGLFTASDFATLQQLGQSILNQGLQPLSMVLTGTDYLHRSLSDQRPTGAWGLILAFAGHQKTVRWQWDRTLQLAAASASVEQQFLANAASARVWKHISGFGWTSAGKNDILLKTILPYPRTEAFWNQIRDSLRRMDWSFAGLCYAGSHLSWFLLSPPEQKEPERDKVSALLLALRQQLRSCRGELILARGPRTIKDLFEVWGVEGKNLEWMLEIKNRLDPAHILNPGRFVGRQ